MYVCVPAHMLGLKDNFWESVFPFHHVSPINQAQFIGLANRCLLPAKPLYQSMLFPKKLIFLQLLGSVVNTLVQATESCVPLAFRGTQVIEVY